MKLNTVMTAGSILGVIFGLGFTLMPAAALGLYDANTNDVGLLLARFFGGSMLGFAALLWSARNAADSEARRAIGLGLFVSFLIALVISLFAQVNGVLNALGWLGVAIFLFFTLAFGYFQFLRPGTK
jgi:hypothetical protein